MLLRDEPIAVVERIGEARLDVDAGDPAEAAGLRAAGEGVDLTIASADHGGGDTRKFGGDAGDVLHGIAACVQCHLGETGRLGRRPELAPHDVTQGLRQHRRVGGDTVVEADVPGRVLPGIAEVESEAGGQPVPAPIGEIVLGHDEDAGVQFRAPDVRVEERHIRTERRFIVDQRGKHEDEMPRRHHEVVHHAEMLDGHRTRLKEPAVRSDVIKHEQSPAHDVAEVPQGAVGLGLGVRGKGDAFQVLAPGLAAQRFECGCLDPVRGSPFPQRQQFAAMVADADVGGIEVVGAAKRG